MYVYMIYIMVERQQLQTCLNAPVELSTRYTTPDTTMEIGSTNVGYTTAARDRVISVLNQCLEWDKFIRLTLTYPTPDSGLTYT